MKNLLYSCLAFLFSDVICIFADDIEDLESVTSYISHWIKIGSASSFSRNVRSRVVIVQTEDSMTVTQSVLDLKELQFRLKVENKKNRECVYSAIILLHFHVERHEVIQGIRAHLNTATHTGAPRYEFLL